MIHYLTREGDAIDAICHAHYGNANRAIDAVLAANRHIADWAQYLPGGISIKLPDLPADKTSEKIQLWD